MAFDCLHFGNEDVRDTKRLMERLEYADRIISDCFVGEGQKGSSIDNYAGTSYDSSDIMKFHEKNIKKYMENLNDDIKSLQDFLLIRRKYFITVYGKQDNEIFKYSDLMWNKYVYDESVDCPYLLDGLIFTPLEQEYVTSKKDKRYMNYEYKWKPEYLNSIDFYVVFEKEPGSNKIMNLYDNTVGEEKNQLFSICNLYVGKVGLDNVERPVLFRENNRGYVTHLSLENGVARDLDRNIIQDKTVVEFYYNNDTKLPKERRWVAIRTRYDKTESVHRYQRKYGNAENTANRNWRSIMYPITMDDFGMLSKDTYFTHHLNSMKSKIDPQLIRDKEKPKGTVEDAYYKLQSKLAEPMRAFHNWIKELMIYTYCHPIYVNRNSVLDIGCGRGGDLAKFYFSKVAFYVGIDPDYSGLFLATDSAVSRYNKAKKRFPDLPEMHFVHADATVLLSYEEQIKKLGKTSQRNGELLKQFFGKRSHTFDRINCQFVIHYMLRDEVSWNNFCDNINHNSHPGTFFMITCFDARQVVELLKNNNTFARYFTDTEGNKRKLFELVKRYDNLKTDKLIGLGHAIDVYNGTFTDKHITEYLVDPKFLEKELRKKCNMKLVQTDMFYNLYEIQRNYFKKVDEFEFDKQQLKRLLDVVSYYDMSDEVNRASIEITKLNRYYVFQKMGETSISADDDLALKTKSKKRKQ